MLPPFLVLVLLAPISCWNSDCIRRSKLISQGGNDNLFLRTNKRNVNKLFLVNVQQAQVDQPSLCHTMKKKVNKINDISRDVSYKEKYNVDSLTTQSGKRTFFWHFHHIICMHCFHGSISVLRKPRNFFPAIYIIFDGIGSHLPL
jgi:hypothetical protein